MPSPVFVSTKSFLSPDQSSLKLVDSAEIQICRAGELGEMTNLPGGSSKLMCSAPALSSASKSASPSASYRLRFRPSIDSSARRRTSCSSLRGLYPRAGTSSPGAGEGTPPEAVAQVAEALHL